MSLLLLLALEGSDGCFALVLWMLAHCCSKYATDAQRHAPGKMPCSLSIREWLEVIMPYSKYCVLSIPPACATLQFAIPRTDLADHVF